MISHFKGNEWQYKKNDIKKIKLDDPKENGSHKCDALN